MMLDYTSGTLSRVVLGRVQSMVDPWIEHFSSFWSLGVDGKPSRLIDALWWYQ